MSRKIWIAVVAAGMVIAGWNYVKSKQAPLHPKAQAIKTAATELGDCSAVIFERHRFTHCIAVPGKHSIMTHVTSSDGLIYRGFGRLQDDLGGRNIAFAVNGGMYDVLSKPIGYYVEKRERLHSLNRNKGMGNFHLLPNGVFFGGSDTNWQVLSSDQFVERISKRPEFGTQSGPMLLIDGALHPQISENGTSLKIRNAVGVDAAGAAHFVISDEAVSFGALARMMRDIAKTSNALFLDGTVSALWYPASKRMDDLYPLGPLIVVTKLPKGKAP